MKAKKLEQQGEVETLNWPRRKIVNYRSRQSAMPSRGLESVE
jgi:hypothetical protein